MLLPDGRQRVGAVAAGRVARRDHHRAAAPDAHDRPLQDAQLGRVDLVVGEVDRQQRGRDLLQVGGWVVVARGVDLVEQVVGVELR